MMATIIICVFIGLALFSAIRYLWKKRQNGGCAGCGDCSSCRLCSRRCLRQNDLSDQDEGENERTSLSGFPDKIQKGKQ